VSRLANIALTEVSTRVLFTPKETTAVSNITGTGNERSILLPSDFDYPIGLTFFSTSTNTLGVNVLGEETMLAAVNPNFLDSFASVGGTPERYMIYGGFIEIDPIPDSRGSLVMRYAAKQPTLVVSTDTPAIDERWHQGWLWKTTELVHLARGNGTAAAAAEGRYVNYMTSTPNDRFTKQTDKSGLGLRVQRS